MVASKTKEDQTAHELFLAEEFIDHLAEAAGLLPHPPGDELAPIAEQRMRETIKAYGMPTWLPLNASQTIAVDESSRIRWGSAQSRVNPGGPR